MIKHVFVGFLNGVDETVGERWYFRYHAKEVVRFVGPWLRRYETFKAYAPPPEAIALGAMGGRTTELWYANVEDFIEARPNDRPYTFESWMAALPARAMTAGVTMVPAMPTEDFLGREPTPEAINILRWYRLIKYPRGVSVEDGEKWYLGVHAQEAKQQPGLLRYVSHRVLENPPIRTPWHRLEELWYENLIAWRAAVIDSPPKYTPPPWKSEPPFVDSVSNFIKYKPDIDFLRDNPAIP